MATHKYVGPEDENRDVPRYGFDEGVLFPPRLAELIAAGHVVKVGAETAPAAAPEPAPAPEEQPKATATPARVRAARPTTRPSAPARKR